MALLKDEPSVQVTPKKDSTISNKTPKEDAKFIIKWDEADKPASNSEKKELKKPKKPEEEDY